MKPAAGMVRVCFIGPSQTAHGAVVGVTEINFFFFMANPATNPSGQSLRRVPVPDWGKNIELAGISAARPSAQNPGSIQVFRG
jgi:hypothetical protein